MAATAEQTCYRHPNRETGVNCSSCGKPICPSCMTPTPVGMRCPECAGQRTQVRTARSISTPGGAPTVTAFLIGINVIIFLASGAFNFDSSGGNSLFVKWQLADTYIADQHQYYRLVTSAFLHENLIHILFNMYLLWVLGRMLEPQIGSRRFGLIYAVALLGGSLGAIVQMGLTSATVGASGAVFGLMGAAFFELRHRGFDPMRSGLGPLIAINLIFSFLFSGISWGGHIGGLVFGSLVALGFHAAQRVRQPLLGWAAGIGLGVVAVVASIALAQSVYG
jgi:membrane associated rhomboid family serine protease